MRILVLCACNPATSPRPSRLIEYFKKSHKVTAMGLNTSSIENVEVVNYSPQKKRGVFGEIALYLKVIFKRFESMIYLSNRMEIMRFLERRSFDLIICHDLVLLPIALSQKKLAKVLFDAREFYPGQYNTPRWNFLFSKFNDYLVKKYMPQADVLVTVSQGLSKLYKDKYNLYVEPLYSFSYFANINPSIMLNNKIRVLYHGSAAPMRKIENMIEAIDFCNPEIEISLMLVCTDKKYFANLVSMVRKRQKKGAKIQIIKPVEFSKLIEFSNDFDVGLYGISATTMNLKFAMPNKFFEYIQSRLAICATPNSEMEEILQKYQNGVITSGFSAKNIAQALNALDRQKIMAMKIKSHQAARELCFESNITQIKSVFRGIFSKNKEVL